jgi:hypothetical protein
MHEIVKNIYIEAGLGNHDESVYKIEQIKGVIPASKLISKTDRKAIVNGVMEVMNINGAKVAKDADERIGVLIESGNKSKEETAAKVKDLKQTIADLEAQTRAVRDEMSKVQIDQRNKETAINAEVAKINSIKEILV